MLGSLSELGDTSFPDGKEQVMKYLVWFLSAVSMVSALNVDIGWWETSGEVSAPVFWGFASVYAFIGLGMEK